MAPEGESFMSMSMATEQLVLPSAEITKLAEQARKAAEKKDEKSGKEKSGKN